MRISPAPDIVIPAFMLFYGVCSDDVCLWAWRPPARLRSTTRYSGRSCVHPAGRSTRPCRLYSAACIVHITPAAHTLAAELVFAPHWNDYGRPSPPSHIFFNIRCLGTMAGSLLRIATAWCLLRRTQITDKDPSLVIRPILNSRKRCNARTISPHHQGT
jgi:hypothetical protein